MSGAQRVRGRVRVRLSADAGRDASHLAGLVVVHCLDDLLLRVHHERPVGEHRLADRLPAEQEHFERAIGQLERYVEDKILVCRRERASITDKLRSARARRDEVVGASARERIETEAVRSYVEYVPLGVLFAIMPWNFPYWQVARALAPALAAGGELYEGELDPAPFDATNKADVQGAGDLTAVLDGRSLTVTGNFYQLFVGAQGPRVQCAALTAPAGTLPSMIAST